VASNPIPYIAVGNVHTFTALLQKDGATYNLTSLTVKIRLIRPNGTLAREASVTIVDAAAGSVSFTNLTTDFDEAGQWQRQWKIVEVPLRSRPFSFPVYA
jgi:uncharacterized protein YfaS (alpha-2-macroglobulin family)